VSVLGSWGRKTGESVRRPLRPHVREAVPMNQSGHKLLRVYFRSDRLRRNATIALTAAFKGAWLGLLRHSWLHQMDEAYYDAAAPSSQVRDYRDDDYNQSGLLSWEAQAIREHFPSSGRLLVLGAGGGREVVALDKLGYSVDGFECHPGLVASAAGLLARIGAASSVRLSPRDSLPDGLAQGPYDGIIIGWGAYMLIRGRARRIALLRQLHRRASGGAPLLVSFFARRGTSKYLQIAARVGNAVARLTGGERVEVGDDLDENFFHRFTEDEIREELDEAGFETVFFSDELYGKAVGRVRASAAVPAGVDGEHAPSK